MQRYGQFCPVALGAEIFAERWTPLILRELLLGSHRKPDADSRSLDPRMQAHLEGCAACGEEHAVLRELALGARAE